jgi:hypothetical protein
VSSPCVLVERSASALESLPSGCSNCAIQRRMLASAPPPIPELTVSVAFSASPAAAGRDYFFSRFFF